MNKIRRVMCNGQTKKNSGSKNIAHSVGILMLVLTAGCIAPLYAATYYVDAQSGNDAKSGLFPGEAWKTIAKVNTINFNPGDQILFRRGRIWREQLTITSSGDANNYIYYGAYAEDVEPIISGADLITQWERESTFIWKATLPFAPRQVFFDGARGISVALDQLDAPLEWNYSENILRVYCAQDPTFFFSDPGIEASVRASAIAAQAKQYISISGLVLTMANEDGLQLNNGSYWLLSNLVSHAHHRYGIHIDGLTANSSNILIIDSEVFNNAAGIQIFHGHDITADYINSSDNADTMNGNGITASQSERIIIKNSMANNNEGIFANGIQFLGCKDCSAHHNLIADNQNANFISSANPGFSNSGTIYHNILVGSKQGITLSADDQSTIISNNLVYRSSESGIRIDSVIAPATLGLINNIVLNNNSYALFVGDSVDARRIAIDHNIYYNVLGNLIFWKGDDVPFADFNAYVALSGKDAHSLATDPLLQDPEYANFRLQPLSPAIDTGLAIGLTIDFEGNAIPQGALPDRGPYEYIPTVTYGDINNDIAITAYDAALAAMLAVDIDISDKITCLLADARKAADVDNSTGISAYDAALIAQRAVGLITRFPVNQQIP